MPDTQKLLGSCPFLLKVQQIALGGKYASALPLVQQHLHLRCKKAYGTAIAHNMAVLPDASHTQTTQ